MANLSSILRFAGIGTRFSWGHPLTWLGLTLLCLLIGYVWLSGYTNSSSAQSSTNPVRKLSGAELSSARPSTPQPVEKVDEMEITRANDDDRAEDYLAYEAIQQQILPLLDRADVHFEAGQYVTPPGENAWEDYQAILELNPNESVAIAGQTKVKSKLIANAEEAVDQGDIAAAENWLVQLDIIAPDSAVQTDLRAEIRKLVAIETERKLRQKEAEELRNTINTTLSQAADEEQRDNPNINKAKDLYERVRELEPENEAAKQGLYRLSDLKLDQAEQALLAGNLDLTKTHIDAATDLYPENKRISSLQLAYDASVQQRETVARQEAEALARQHREAMARQHREAMARQQAEEEAAAATRAAQEQAALAVQQQEVLTTQQEPIPAPQQTEQSSAPPVQQVEEPAISPVPQADQTAVASTETSSTETASTESTSAETASAETSVAQASGIGTSGIEPAPTPQAAQDPPAAPQPETAQATEPEPEPAAAEPVDTEPLVSGVIAREKAAASPNTPTPEEEKAEANARLLRDGIEAYYSGDYNESFELLYPLAEDNIARAQFRIGIMYQFGRSVAQNPDLAEKWFTAALPELLRKAQEGVPWAQTDLGTAYEFGISLQQDYSRAAHWYQLAADQGYAGAQTNLGVLYAQGDGVPYNRSQAIFWFRRAAENGDRVAIENLAALGIEN